MGGFCGIDDGDRDHPALPEARLAVVFPFQVVGIDRRPLDIGLIGGKGGPRVVPVGPRLN